MKRMILAFIFTLVGCSSLYSKPISGAILTKDGRTIKIFGDRHWDGVDVKALDLEQPYIKVLAGLLQQKTKLFVGMECTPLFSVNHARFSANEDLFPKPAARDFLGGLGALVQAHAKRSSQDRYFEKGNTTFYVCNEIGACSSMAAAIIQTFDRCLKKGSTQITDLIDADYERLKELSRGTTLARMLDNIEASTEAARKKILSLSSVSTAAKKNLEKQLNELSIIIKAWKDAAIPSEEQFESLLNMQGTNPYLLAEFMQILKGFDVLECKSTDMPLTQRPLVDFFIHCMGCPPEGFEQACLFFKKFTQTLSLQIISSDLAALGDVELVADVLAHQGQDAVWFMGHAHAVKAIRALVAEGWKKVKVQGDIDSEWPTSLADEKELASLLQKISTLKPLELTVFEGMLYDQVSTGTEVKDSKDSTQEVKAESQTTTTSSTTAVQAAQTQQQVSSTAAVASGQQGS